MKNYCIAVVVGLLIAIPSGAMAVEATGSTTLLCTSSLQGHALYANLTINYDQKLVNGKKAVFTDDMIVWFDPAHEHNELNRLSGSYTSWPENEALPEPPPVYNCQKATAPKF